MVKPKDNTPGKDSYIGLVIFGGILLAGLVAASVEGFGPYDNDLPGARATTLWDWLELLIVPTVLALAVFLLNGLQKKSEQTRDDREKEKAEDNRRQSALDAYFSRMMELMLTHELEPHGSNHKAGAVARAVTLAALPTLDGSRKSELLGFLCESELLKKPSPAFNIGRADLSGMIWSKVLLTEIDLGGVNLCHADLSDHVGLLKCDFSGSNLCFANLTGASLEGSNLRFAKLRKAILHQTNLEKTDLSHASLRFADLSSARLHGADLSSADLSGAILRDAKLNTTFRKDENGGLKKDEVKLTQAKLAGADLGNADLQGAILEGTDLRDVKNWTITQLRKASYGETIGTVMPDGIKLQATYADNGEVFIKGPTFEQWVKNYLVEHGGAETDIRDVMVFNQSSDIDECEFESEAIGAAMD
jgi:uncharacterized protein YjbI with pentapeptide repeats